MSIKRLFSKRELNQSNVAMKSQQQEFFVSRSELYRPLMILLVLIIAIVISALSVIKAAYDYRRLFNDHQILVHQWDELQIEWGQLLLEQSTWGGHGRIENEAENRLQMRVPNVEETEIIRR